MSLVQAGQAARYVGSDGRFLRYLGRVVRNGGEMVTVRLRGVDSEYPAQVVTAGCWTAPRQMVVVKKGRGGWPTFGTIGRYKRRRDQ